MPPSHLLVAVARLCGAVCNPRPAEAPPAAPSGDAAVGGGTFSREQFLAVYKRLKDEILYDPTIYYTPETRQWVEEVPETIAFSPFHQWLIILLNSWLLLLQMIDYNVPKGKLNRAIGYVENVKLLRGWIIREEEFFLATVMSCCIEWLQACALMLDDVMDNSHTRRSQICWHKLPKVGLHAINDAILLKCHVDRIVRRYFRQQSYYQELYELLEDVGIQTSLGQMLDLIITHEDLCKYTEKIYLRIVHYKTALYSFFLPVAAALVVCGEDRAYLGIIKPILIEMGTYFQIQDDYIDCFGDPKVTGKIGTDIEDRKCTWLIVEALERADETQLTLLQENYGKSDPDCVDKVKTVYRELKLQDVYLNYERRIYENIVAGIRTVSSAKIQSILEFQLNLIYKRKL